MPFKNNLLPRGFKAKAERISEHLRKEIGVHVCNPLDAFVLAKHLNVIVFNIDEIGLPVNELRHLKGLANNTVEWHALTFPINQTHVIVHNNINSPARIQSDLMHELAHIICQHHENQITTHDFPWHMRSFNPQLEAEAEYLGSCLQISKAGLFAKLKYGATEDEIADYFLASKQMVKYRIGQTAARKILKLNY
ncbi:MAG: ImmA/IrrE family metallo-endopeptidase [Bacteroidetes bacterium]|nr:MAG: ImmA/IrrE family metallo-endopeptidase [Bacteroidota bacterium]